MTHFYKITAVLLFGAVLYVDTFYSVAWPWYAMLVVMVYLLFGMEPPTAITNALANIFNKGPQPGGGGSEEPKKDKPKDWS